MVTTLRKAILAVLASLALSLYASPAEAQAGFQVQRLELAAPGNWFFTVDHPWYSSTRYFAAGVALDYSHNPLVLYTYDGSGALASSTAVIANQLMAHVDLAASLFDRVQISATLPVVLYEGGASGAGISPNSLVVGDPRVGALVRLWHHADRDAFSLHVGANLWIPIGATGKHAGDASARVLPKIVVAGFAREHWLWSASLGYLIRGGSSIGPAQSGAGNAVGQELQLAAALGYTNRERTWSIGPELQVASTTTPRKGPDGVERGDFLGKRSTSLELLFGGHVQVARMFLLGAGLGLGFLGQPGTPDFRLLATFAYAPEADRDHDGIYDFEDACPHLAGFRNADPLQNGCAPDRDKDGVADTSDVCPDVPRGESEDKKRPGCPILDLDHDGIVDAEDKCPDVAQGPRPDPARPGCPDLDPDHDGVFGAADLCPDEPAGEHPDAAKLGCPSRDRDQDGIADAVDVCPDVHKSSHPDPKKPGCPDTDSDGDGIYDSVDACPAEPGAPNTDPAKNGCKGLVVLKAGKLQLLAPVFFATNKDIILPVSFPVLQACKTALDAMPEVKRVRIEGHTDNRGKPQKNLSLSDRRAKSVMRWMIQNGIAADRLEAKGYGQTRPLVPNTTDKNRAINRRVEFQIVDPAPEPTTSATPPAPAATPPAAAPPRKAPGRFGAKKRGVRR